MDQRPAYCDCNSTRLRIVCVAFALAAVPSCAAPPEDERSEGTTAPSGESIPHRVSAQAASPASVPASASASTPASFTLFESGQVRPLAMSPDKQHLFAVNTPDNRLEIFRVKTNRLIHTGSVPVGLEPVAVAARTNREVWVVNHLSDSVSVVE